MSASNAPATALPQQTRRIVVLLAAATFLNYFDRGNLATASPLLKGELALSNTQMGALFSAFFWSYAPLQPFMGWLAQRFDVRYVLGCGLALWGVATALTGLATTFTEILALRILLGIGESVAYPCNAAFLGRRAAVHERGRANGLIATGQALGPACGTLIGGFMMARYGWRSAFVVFGLASLVWLVPWGNVTSGGASAGSAADLQPVPYRVLLRERALWGTSLGHFCGNYAYYFALTWLPLLLVKIHGFSVARMATVITCVYALQAVSAPMTGWLCDRLIARGATPNRVLKTTMNLALGGVTVAMALCATAGAATSIILLLVAGACFGMQSAPLGAISQTLGGPRASGQWMGIQNLCANTAGMLAPLITGLVVDRTGSFYWAFLIAAMVTIGGALAFGIVIRRVEPVAWPDAHN
jgi:MFS family permease